MLDAKLILCEDQDMPNAGSIVSDNIIDVGAYEDALGEEEHLRLRVEVSAKPAAGTSLKVVACHDTVGPIDASSIDWATSEAVVIASLVKGYCIMDVGLPVKHGRIIGLWMTAAGNCSTGLVNAYVYAR